MKELNPEEMTRDDVLDKISECELVVREIENSPVFKIIVKDCKEQCQVLDNNWQNILDDDKLSKARMLKMAYSHILNLKKKYEDDLKTAKDHLSFFDDKSNIHRDMDNV